MSTTVEIINLTDGPVAHPLVPGVIASGASDSRAYKQVNADDYSGNFDELAERGIVVLEDGTERPGATVITGVTTLTDEHAVAVDATAPFTITLEDAATAGDGFKLYILVRSSEGVKATGTLTLTGNAADTDEVTIGTKTYTFQDTLTNVDGNVDVGATASDSIDNLIAAITLGAGAGTAYAAATTVHPTVVAAAGAGDTMTVTAKTAGVAGNSIATTVNEASGTDLEFAEATLTGGDGAGDITVAAAGADTVLGDPTAVLAAEGDALRLVVNGTDWEAQ